MKTLLVIFCYNERGKVEKVVKKFSDYALYDVLIMDDGSTDGYQEDLTDLGCQFRVLRNEVNQGVGHAVKQALDFARRDGYDAVVFVAGNDKDAPEDVPKLLDEILKGYDFVQGSRYLPGGAYEKMPFYRVIATRYIHPVLLSLVTGKKITDSTNGFRAFRLSILNDPEIRLDQSWLDQYELEPYLFYKVLTRGYRVKEVPVKKRYPDKKLGYTKMKPVTGWWSILRPLIYLALGIKK